MSHSIEVDAHTSQLAVVRKFIVSSVEDSTFSDREIADVILAVDEAFTNIIRHSYTKEEMEGARVEIHLSIDREALTVSLLDQGKGFNPDDGEHPMPMPDVRSLSKMKKRGGLGVFLIHRLMDDVTYRKGGRRNEIRMTKVRHH